MASGDSFDAVVIGAGEAGAEVVSRALGAGMRVAMLYREPYGSTCHNTGCIPSKRLIHHANVAHAARTAARAHVRAGPVEVDYARIVDEGIQETTSDRDRARVAASRQDGLEAIEAPASFVGPHEVAAGHRVLTSDRIFIATGARPGIPPIEGLQDVNFLSSEGLLELRELPRHLVIAGGGYVACELGQAFARLGAKVTIVEMLPRLLGGEEPEVSEAIAAAFQDEGIDVRLRHRVARVRPANGGVKVVAQSDAYGEVELACSHLAVATGRRPNSDKLHLDNAGIETDGHGAILVDDYLKTTAEGVWAIGDVNGLQPFTRISQDGKLAFANAFEGARLAMDRDALPHAIFTDPEIGAVGLTEAEARSRGIDPIVSVVDFDQVSRARITGRTAGVIKTILDPESGRLLGAHIAGPRATDLIYAAVVTIRHRGAAREISEAVGNFPTYVEGLEGTVRNAAARQDASLTRRPLAALGMRG